MNHWARTILIVLAISAAIYLLIAAVLVFTDRPKARTSQAGPIDFTDAIVSDYAGMPELTLFEARDGASLGYRIYGDPAAARRVIVLVHGSGWHGMQFHAMASALAGSGDRLVVVPDLRGHGPNPERRGDVDHIGQLEEDLADLIDRILQLAPGRPVVLGGHSSGGGLVVRFAGGDYGDKADAFLLLAPFLKYDAPTTRPDSGGWASPATRRIIGLTMLNAVGITVLNHLPVIAFAMPQAVLDGPYGATATTSYSYRLNTSFAPRFDYAADLAAIDRPLLVIAGEADEAFHAGRYEEVIAPRTATGEYHVVPEATHIGILTDPRVIALVEEWADRVGG